MISKKISVVIPVLNEEKNISKLYNVLIQALRKVSHNFEIIYVDDGSTDKSFQNIKKITRKNNKVKLISFTRNFGKQSALQAGLKFSSGDYVFCLDSDLQHPVILLIDFLNILKKKNNNFEIVHGIRIPKKNLKNYLTFNFSKLLKLLSPQNLKLDVGGSEFYLMTKRVVQEIVRYDNEKISLRSIILDLGFKKKNFYYKENNRYKGSSKFNFYNFYEIFISSLISLSAKPIRLISITGFLLLFFSIISFVSILYFKFSGVEPYIITYQTLLIIFLSGLNVFSVGILGEYIANIRFNKLSNKSYIVSKKINLS